jgi:hypothetical protein
MSAQFMSEAEYLRAQVRALRVKVQAAAFAVGAIRVLASDELGAFDPDARLGDVADQVERLADALGLNLPRPQTDPAVSGRCSHSGGGWR